MGEYFLTKRWNELDPRLKQNESKRHDYLAGEIDKRGGGDGGPEEDPVFSRSPAGRITDSDLTNWNKKYDKAELKGNCILFYNNDVEVKRICLDSSFSTKEYTMNSIRSALESMDELYCKVVASLPVIGDENTFYLKRTSDTFDIYFYEYQNHIPVRWCHVGGSTVSEEYVRNLVSDKLSAKDLKKINNKDIFVRGDQDNLTKKDLGIPTKIGELDNDMNYVRMNDAMIKVDKADDESNYRYIFRQGSRGQVYQSIEFPKFQLSKGEVVTDPEGYEKGDYLHLQFGNGDDVYIPISNIVGAVYEGLPRKFQEGETAEKIGTYLNNVDVSINNTKISANFTTTPSDEEITEYKSKKGVDTFPYHTTKQWHDMVKLAMTDVLTEIANMTEEEMLEDSFIKGLDSAILAIGSAAAMFGIVSNMTCNSIKQKFNDLFEEEEGEGGDKKYRMKDEKMENDKQDKLYDDTMLNAMNAHKLNFRSIKGFTGNKYSLINPNPAYGSFQDPIQLKFADLWDQPTIFGEKFKQNMDPYEYGIQPRLVTEEDSGIWLHNELDEEGMITGTRITTYMPDMQTIVLDENNKLKFAEEQIKDEHCIPNSITGRVIKEGTIKGGTQKVDGNIVPIGHIAAQSIGGGNIELGSITNDHLEPGAIGDTKIDYQCIKGYKDVLNPGHIAKETITGYNIKPGEIRIEHLGDETINKIREKIKNVKLGDLIDSGDKSGVKSYHFTNDYKTKLDSVKVLDNDEVTKDGLQDEIVFREENGKFNIQLRQSFKINLEGKIEGLDAKSNELSNDLTAFKQKVEEDKKSIGIGQPVYLNLNSAFVNDQNSKLSVTKQNGMVFVTGTIFNNTVIYSSQNILSNNAPLPDGYLPRDKVYRRSINMGGTIGFYFGTLLILQNGQFQITNIRDVSGMQTSLPQDTQININMCYSAYEE